MQVGNRLLPYPVLNKDCQYSSYKKSSYELCYDEPFCEGNNLILKNIFAKIENDGIRELVLSNKAEIYLVVECGHTVFRKKYKLDVQPKDIKINMDDLEGKVYFSSYITNIIEIKDYTDKDLEQEYDGFSVTFEKNSILTIDDGYNITVKRESEDEEKVESIFSIVKNNNKLSTSIEYDVTDEKILIKLPPESYSYYDAMKNNKELMNIFFSVIGIPALTYAIHEKKESISNEEDILDNIIDCKWFSSIANAYKSVFKKELSFELWNNIDEVQVQMLLNNGYVNGIKEIFELDRRDIEENEDE